MVSIGSSSREFTPCVAPSERASSTLRGSISTAMIVVAPASFAPWIAAIPTPPQPITATESPRPTFPVLMAAPMPAMMPQPSSPTAAGSTSSSTFVHWPAATRVFSAKAPMPSAGESSVPSSSVIFCVALNVLKQYCASPRRQARHSPQTARQFRMTRSPTTTLVTSSPIAATTPVASWPSRNG